MSVSGFLRMELGDYIQFDPSMLPKNILNKNIKDNFVQQEKGQKISQKINRETSLPKEEKNIDFEIPKYDSDPIKKDKIEEANKKADSIGMTAEEFMQIFNIAQEARVKELAQIYNADNMSQYDIEKNPFS